MNIGRSPSKTTTLATTFPASDAKHLASKTTPKTTIPVRDAKHLELNIKDVLEYFKCFKNLLILKIPNNHIIIPIPNTLPKL